MLLPLHAGPLEEVLQVRHCSGVQGQGILPEDRGPTLPMSPVTLYRKLRSKYSVNKGFAPRFPAQTNLVTCSYSTLLSITPRYVPE